MGKIKEPCVAGSFYSADKEQLQKQIELFKQNSKNSYTVPTRAVIVPHAGLVYSGQLAYEGISQLDKNIKNIFIFAPAHRSFFNGLAVSSFDEWQTPLGTLEVNQEINSELVSKFGVQMNDGVMESEHAIEVELPFIQTVFENVKIVPVLIGQENIEKIAAIISHYFKDAQNGFVISSDLSHYMPDEKAKQVDAYTAQLIETGTENNFVHELACGATGILGLIRFSNANNYSLIRIDMTNSGNVSNDKERVVGYGTWFLWEGKKNEFLKKYYSEFILNLCKAAIMAKFTKKQITVNCPQVFLQPGATFVTLEKNNYLRGCIGSIIAHRTILEDILKNAQSAAFADPRFAPVAENELSELQIAVSLLSVPKQMTFEGEEDLLNQIQPYKDGIIIKDKGHQAVYLPSVWEQLPDKKAFLNSLKVKAGLKENHFSDTFEAYRFETVYVK